MKKIIKSACKRSYWGKITSFGGKLWGFGGLHTMGGNGGP